MGATGQEMAMQMALKMFGINTEETREQILNAARSVTSFDARLSLIESVLTDIANNQRVLIEAINSLAPKMESENERSRPIHANDNGSGEN